MDRRDLRWYSCGGNLRKNWETVKVVSVDCEEPYEFHLETGPKAWFTGESLWVKGGILGPYDFHKVKSVLEPDNTIRKTANVPNEVYTEIAKGITVTFTLVDGGTVTIVPTEEHA